jgi:hypothetical protein
MKMLFILDWRSDFNGIEIPAKQIFDLKLETNIDNHFTVGVIKIAPVADIFLKTSLDYVRCFAKYFWSK